MTPAAYARRVLVMAAGQPAPEPARDPALLEETIAVRRELIRIGTLLNQATRRLHQGQRSPGLKALVEQVRDLVETRIAARLPPARSR